MDRIKRAFQSSEGFTLIELLIVIGIIVALAAAVVPQLVGQSGEGEVGAQAAEEDSVQTAMDTMMADIGIAAVTGRVGPALSTNSFTTLPTEGPLTGYLREATTTYFYCWDTTGKVTQQDTAAAACP
jgi:general secretion pathway protein G